MSKETQTRRKSPVFLLVCPRLRERRELVQDLGRAPSAQPPEGFPSTAGMQMTSGNWLAGTRMFHTHNIGGSVGDTVGHRPPCARSSTCVVLVCHLSRRVYGPSIICCPCGSGRTTTLPWSSSLRDPALVAHQALCQGPGGAGGTHWRLQRVRGRVPQWQGAPRLGQVADALRAGPMVEGSASPPCLHQPLWWEGD